MRINLKPISDPNPSHEVIYGSSTENSGLGCLGVHEVLLTAGKSTLAYLRAVYRYYKKPYGTDVNYISSEPTSI